jgi:drug/metabolite transporter (DMT)-like permease
LLLFNYLAFEKIKPSIFDKIAIPLGIAGSSIVLISGENLHATGISTFDIFLLILSPSSWAFGALLGKQIKMPKSILASSALQMIGGSLFLISLSFFHGEWSALKLSAISTKSIWGLLYLTVGGSFLGYSCFAIMMKNLEARIVGTYAFVNPVVALTFGYFFGEKIFEFSIVMGASMSIAAVIMTFLGARYRKKSLFKVT